MSVHPPSDNLKARHVDAPPNERIHLIKKSKQIVLCAVQRRIADQFQGVGSICHYRCPTPSG